MPFLQNTIEEVTTEKGIFETIKRIFESKLFNIGKNEITLLTIIQFIIFVVVFYFLSRLFRRFLKKQVLPHLRITENARFVILRFTHYGLMVVGVLIGINSIGIELTSLTVGIGVIGVGIAFGLQNVTSNFISGIIMLFERNVNVGDYITVDNINCKVVAINIRSTTVLTPDNTVLIIPNSKFIEGIVTNWSVLDPKIRLTIPVRVSYYTDVQLVTDILLQCAKEQEDVLDEPPPLVRFNGYGDFGVEFNLFVWIAKPDPQIRGKVTSDLYYAIDKLFKKHGIVVPFQEFGYP